MMNDNLTFQRAENNLLGGFLTEPLYDYDYNYSFVFFFERKYYSKEFTRVKETWMNENWWLSIVYSLVYITLIFIGQRLMKQREKFHLYRSLVAWNITLSIFSALGALRFMPSFVQILRQKGVTHSVCILDYHLGVPGCWTWLFILSKLVELVDTLFIVLRKQKLIFLHWYHHATVLVYCWYSVMTHSSTGRWFIVMNLTVKIQLYQYTLPNLNFLFKILFNALNIDTLFYVLVLCVSGDAI
jgi:elongation of very long chain fatty acids protein 6